MKSAMGRTTNVLRKGARAAKCLTLLKLATSRIKVVRNTRSLSAKKMRGEIAQLIKSGQDAHVYITKADALIKQENMVAAYDLLDHYCRAIMSGFATIELQRKCPADMKEPIATIIYAAPRCVELTELPAIKDAFVAKYGKEFAAAASELRSDCGVNTQIIELLSTQPATGDKKLKLLKEICKEHNVDWTPGEVLAGPAAATGHSEVKVERIQATGSTKANAVGVGEAGPSKSAPMPEASKHGASNKIGLSEAMVSTASKTSDQKQSSSSEGDVTKGKPSVPERFKGVTSTAPVTKDASKAAVFAADASKVDDTKLSAFEEEDARRLRERILQSLRGASFVHSEVEAEANAADFEKPVDADAQVVASDSDNESFVSVEEEKFEDDVETSSHGAASRKESFGDNPNQGFSEAVLNRPSLSQKLSTAPHQDIYARTSSKNSEEAMEIHEVLANSNLSSLPSKISHEDMSFKANSKKSLNTEAELEKEKSKDGLNIGKFVEAHSVEGLKENKMINERKDNFFRVSSKDESTDNFLRMSSKESSIVEEMMEEESRKDSVNVGKLIEVQSVEQLNDDRKVKEKVAEELSIETSEQEDLQRKFSLEEKSVIATTSSVKDSLEEKSAEVTKESSFKWKSSERYSLEAIKTVEGLGDESCLHSEGIVEVMPSVATADFKVVRNHAEECSFDANEAEFVAEVNPWLPASEIFKNQSGSEAVGKEASLSTSEFPEGVCDDASRVFDKEPSPTFEKALETGGGDSVSLPAVGGNAEELVGALSAFATLENSQDFTVVAKAIAAEAARLAVLDYAKRLAESSSIPLELGELSKLGTAFEENKGPQVRKAPKTKGNKEYTDSEGFGYPGDKKSYETDSIKEEKIFKVETTLNYDNVRNSDHLDANEMNANNEKSNFSVADDPLDGDSDTENIPKLQEMVTENEDINPFAANVATNTDKDSNPPLSKTANEEPSWVDMTPYGQTSKVGDFGNSDHLDVFFRRKAPMMYEENPMFDEERYDYPKFKPDFIEKRMHYGDSDTKKSSLQENMFSRPLFDTPTEGGSTIFKESSDFSEGPFFDGGDGGSFKSPVFDEGPEPYDCAFSSDDGLEKSSSAVADKGGPQSPISINNPASFDLEPEPCLAKVGDEERKESPPKGQLKWQSKKPSSAVTGNESGTSLGISGNPMSRRSRRQPQDYDGSKHHGDHTGQFTSRSNLLQHHDNEQDRKDEDKVVEKKTLGREQVRPYVSGSSAMSQWPSDPPKWVSGQSDYESSLEDEWGFTSTKIVSTRTTKSPARFDNRQRVRPEDFYFPEKDDLTRFDNKQRVKPEDSYFPEKDDLTRNSASTGVSLKTRKSPTRMTQQQLMTPDYVGVEEDPMGYKINHSIPRIPKVYQHGMIVDDRIEELQGKYNPSMQTSEQSKRTSAGSGFDIEQQQHHQQQTPGMRSEYKHYSEDGGESSRIRPVPSRQQPKEYKEEEPMIQDDEPLDHGSSTRSRISNLSQLEKDVDEDNKQRHHQQEEPGIGSKVVGERLRTRPMSNRQQENKYIDVEKPFLVSRYEPTMQDDELLDYGSINKLRTSKLNQLEEDLEGKEKMRSEYRKNREDPGESLRTRPMSSRLQPKKFIEEESYLGSRYMTRSQDGQSLDDGSSNNSRIPKLYQSEKDVDEGHEGLQGGDSFQTHRDGSGKRASGSSGVDRWYQQHRQQEEEAFESGYVHYEEVTAGRDRILMSQLSAGRKPSDLEEVQDLASAYKPLNQLDNQVESAPLARPLPSRHQEKKHVETTNTPITTDDHLLGCQKEEELFIPRISSQQKQGPQQKQNWQTSPEVCERDSQSKRQNPVSLQQHQIQKDMQQSVPGHWQKQSMAEEEDMERQHFQSPSYKNHQKEKKDLHSFDETCELQQENQMPKSTSSLEGRQEQVGKPSKSPLYSHKQDSRLGDNSSKSDQQGLEQEVVGASTRKERRSQEGGFNKQQEKTLNETEPLSRPHKSRTEEERVSGKEDKSGTKSQLFEQPSQLTSPPLDSSISDPIVLATIPPPLKKPSKPPAVKLESSSSAPSPSKPPEAKVPKVPQRPPNLEDLAANFEAFRKARKGE